MASSIQNFIQTVQRMQWSDYLDIFVSKFGYRKTDGMVQNANHGYHDGMKYLGSVKED